jgi:hypothetical protein
MLEENKTCVWSICDLPSCISPRVFLTTSECPKNIRLDEKHRRSYFQTENAVYVHDWKTGNARKLHNAPNSVKDIGIGKNGELVVTTMEQIPENAFIRNAKGEIIRNSENEKSFSYKGKIHLDRFSVGLTYMASIWKSLDGETFQLLDTSVTNWAAGDTMGFRIFRDDERNPSGALDPLEPSNGSFESWPDPKKPAPSAETIKKVSVFFKNGGGSDPVEYLPWDENTSLIYQSVFGDYRHIGLPILRLDLSNQVLTPILESTKQENSPPLYSIQLVGMWALITTEQGNREGIVLNLRKKGQIVKLDPKKKFYIYPLREHP